MKILAPVNTLESAKAFVDAGVGEIYLGYDDGLFRTYSFTGRGKVAQDHLTVLPSYECFCEIVAYGHSKGTKVNFLANIPFLHNGTYQSEEMSAYFRRYVSKAVSADVDAVVVGDMGLLLELNKMRLPVNLHASLFLNTMNVEQLNFLKSIGIKRVTLSYQVSMQEIVHICKIREIEIEVVGYQGCSFFNGLCGMMHAYGEGIRNDFKPGISCRALYKVTDAAHSKDSRIFLCNSSCSLCKIYELEKCGVHSLKMVGRDNNYINTLKVITLYQETLCKFRSGDTTDKIRADLPDWWKRMFCKAGSCKYTEDGCEHEYMI